MVSDSNHHLPTSSKRLNLLPGQQQPQTARSVGNLRLGILPENRAINFQEPFVYNTSNGLQIKSYGLIDDKKGESGYSSSDNAASSNGSANSPNSSSRASPRGSIEEGKETESPSSADVRSKIMAFNKRGSSSDVIETPSSRSMTPSPPNVTSQPQVCVKPAARLPAAPASAATPPKKPARTKIPVPSSSSVVAASSAKESPAIIDVVVADDDDEADDDVDNSQGGHEVRREYKMVRLARGSGVEARSELGIIIAKKRLRDVPTTGFKVVHIEPDGIVDR